MKEHSGLDCFELKYTELKYTELDYIELENTELENTELEQPGPCDQRSVCYT